MLRTILRTLAVFVFFLLAKASSARAAFPPCPALGDAVIRHTCFHARFGPYRSVQATRWTEKDSAPNVDAPHTYFDVLLSDPTIENVVTYKTQGSGRRGAWAIFHDSSTSIRLETFDGRSIDPVFKQANTACALLSGLSVFELGDERVRVILGPASVARTTLVLELTQDFIISNGRDADGDGFGSERDTVASFCSPPTGYVQNADDCDDRDPRVNPGAVEFCDGVDQNCNGSPDDIGLPCSVGLGACLRDGVSRCSESGAQARCDATPGPATSESCDGKDNNCDGVDDLATSGLCAEQEAPRCIVDRGTVRCGCTNDNDCGGAKSGRVCDLDSRRCIDGCVDRPGRNGCGPRSQCSSSDPTKPGLCEDVCSPACSPGSSCKAGVCSIDSRPGSSFPDENPKPQSATGTAAGAGCGCGVRANVRSSGVLMMLFLLIARLRRKHASSPP
jgi:Putative metal-binding motif